MVEQGSNSLETPIAKLLSGGRSQLFVFFDEAVDQGDEFFAGAGKDEGPGCGIPVEFETGGEGRDPDLANRGIGSDDELGGWFFKDDVEDAVLLFDFEAGFVFFFTGDEVLLECFECAFGGASEFEFVLHETSLAIEGDGSCQAGGRQLLAVRY
jgi:hypothetical protein